MLLGVQIPGIAEEDEGVFLVVLSLIGVALAALVLAAIYFWATGRQAQRRFEMQLVENRLAPQEQPEPAEQPSARRWGRRGSPVQIWSSAPNRSKSMNESLRGLVCWFFGPVRRRNRATFPNLRFFIQPRDFPVDGHVWITGCGSMASRCCIENICPRVGAPAAHTALGLGGNSQHRRSGSRRLNLCRMGTLRRPHPSFCGLL